MTRSRYTIALFCWISIALSIPTYSQNLITNGSFEDILYCPNSSSQLIYAEPWFTPTYGTPDLFNECATDDSFGVPNNYFGFQYAHTGAGYAGGYWRILNTPGREYISTQLQQPLIEGQIYSVSFWINLADIYCGLNQGGAYLSADQPDLNDNNILPFTPQIALIGGFQNDYDNWVKIAGCYVAEGGEQYITIGNFSPTFNSPFDPACNLASYSYYFIDDVAVIGLPDLELDGPYIVCDQYVIDPGIPDVEYEWSDGSTGPSLVVTESGIYGVTISTDCASVSDEVEVIVHEPEIVEAGPDAITICEGETYTINLQPENYEYVWQDGTTGPDYTITDPGVYQVTMDDGCIVTTDQIEVSQDVPPELYFLGDDVTLCPGDNIEIEFDPLVGNLLWQDSSTAYLYTISHAGNYTLTITNACGEFVDDFTVFPNYPPDFDLGPDTTAICDGDPFNILLDPGLGDFVWQDGSESNSYLISGPGIYSVTVSNDCGSVSQNIVVGSADTLATFDLGPDLTLCPGQQYILYPSISNASLLWQDGSAADSMVVNSPGIYFLQASNICSSVADTLTVSLNADPPSLSLPAQVLLCQGESIVLAAGAGGVTYQWSEGTVTDSLSVSLPGEYSLTISNACGSDSDTTIVADGGPSPSVSLGNDITFCPGDNIQLAPGFSDVSLWLWSDGSTDSVYTVSGNEVVTVQVSNVCGIAFDTLQAVVLPATPLFNLGADTSLCPGNSLLLSINTPNVNVEWSDGSISNQFLVQNPGTYFATISNACGENIDSITVDLLPPVPSLDLGIDLSLCPGEVITLDPGLNNVNYLWQNGSTSTSFNATQAGTIILSVTNDCGIDSDTLEITESTEGPDVNLGPDVLACEGENITLASDISGVEFLWQDGSTASDFSTSSSGTFILQVSNNCGVDADTIEVEISGHAPDINLGPDTSLCSATSFTLFATNDPDIEHLWQDGSTLSSFIVNSAGTYSLLETNRCGEDADTIQVDFLSPPQLFTLGPDTTLCPGESIVLNAPSSNDIITWQDGSHFLTMLADQAKTYSLELANECGTTRDEMVLSFNTDIPHVDLNPVSVLCPGEVVELDVTQVFPAIYSWNTGSTEPILSVNVPGTYSVLVHTFCSDAEGVAEVLMSDTCFSEISFFVPNIFSPNDDNINDVFSIGMSEGIEVISMQGEIFDRWGNLVFQSGTIPFLWDGNFDDTPMNPGVYIYSIEVSYFDQAVERKGILHGDITLIR